MSHLILITNFIRLSEPSGTRRNMVITQGELKIEVPMNNAASSSSDEAVEPEVGKFNFQEMFSLKLLQIPPFGWVPPHVNPQYHASQYHQPFGAVPLMVNYPVPGQAYSYGQAPPSYTWGWNERQQRRKKSKR